MKKKFLFSLILTLTLTSHLQAQTIASQGRAKVIKQTSDKTSCFPSRLKNILLKISRDLGKPVVVVSGYRSPQDNRRRGGAKNSQHIKCKAADFRVPGVSMQRVGKYLARMKNRGGAGFYCRGRFHVDVASRRSWGGCKSQFISYDGADLFEENEASPSPYTGDIQFEEGEDHDAHEDMIDYEEAEYYDDVYEI